MTPFHWGILSALLAVGSGSWYAYRTLKSTIQPHLTSWALWTLIGGALLASYWTAGAGEGENVYVAIVGFVSPLVITFIALKSGKWHRPDWVDWICVGLALASLALWAVVQGDKELSLYALILAIAADGFTVGPMVRVSIKEPMVDKPGPWALFALASAVNMGAITTHTWANWVYPGYMTLGAGAIALLLWLGNKRSRKTPIVC